MSFWNDKTVLVTGGNGFLGKWVCRELEGAGVDNIRIPSSSVTDLRVWDNCVSVMQDVDIVLHLAGRDGGLGYNMEHPGSIFYDNAIMNLQLMEAARKSGVKTFVSAGTVCAYPANAKIPLEEDDLWNGYPDSGNAPYCLAKKMGLVQGQAYRNQYGFSAVHLLLTNMYGPGDVFNPEKSRVVASLIRKFVEAKRQHFPEVSMWGTGKASRELLYVGDAARAFLLAAEHCRSSGPINIGSGMETTIREMAEMIAEIVGYNGNVLWDSSKPEGQMRRCSDVSRAKSEFGFSAEVGVREGLEKTIEWYSQYFI